MLWNPTDFVREILHLINKWMPRNLVLWQPVVFPCSVGPGVLVQVGAGRICTTISHLGGKGFSNVMGIHLCEWQNSPYWLKIILINELEVCLSKLMALGVWKRENNMNILAGLISEQNRLNFPCFRSLNSRISMSPNYLKKSKALYCILCIVFMISVLLQA